MTSFIIKSGICMILFFGLYWFLLRKEKLLIFNRYYLIFSILFSLAVPFSSFSLNLGFNIATNKILTSIYNLDELRPLNNKLALSIKEPALSGNLGSDSPAQSSVVKTGPMDTRRILLFIYLVLL